MVSLRSRFIALIVAFVGCSPAFAADGDTTEALLKEAKVDYKTVSPGLFRVTLESKEGLTIVIVQEAKYGKDNKGNDILSVVVYARCLVTAADYKQTAPVTTWMNEINSAIQFGSVYSLKEKDGGTSYWRTASMWLKSADITNFANMLYVCHFDSFDITKKLKALTEN